MSLGEGLVDLDHRSRAARGVGIDKEKERVVEMSDFKILANFKNLLPRRETGAWDWFERGD
jgi:hypothetical protein